MNTYESRSLEAHRKSGGKLAISSKFPLNNKDDLSIAYTPGVAEPCRVIDNNPEAARELTIKGNTVAIVSDGSAVLGLGNIGPLAAIPVMEGKAILFKEYADIDAFPITLATQNTEEIIETIKRISPVFGGINLEDISAPRCFEIENRLQDLGIPVFHDDQHGTAIVLGAALLNASKLLGKPISEMKIVINGAGAAGISIAKMLTSSKFSSTGRIKELIICDRQGALHKDRQDLTKAKQALIQYINPKQQNATLIESLAGADVFIGVSQGNLLKACDIKHMAKDAIIFALANPIPEIEPDEARKGGAAIIATGRSDYPNQVNNVLAFPGIFRGTLDAKGTRITDEMKNAAIQALSNLVGDPTHDFIIPSPLDKRVAKAVAKAVKATALAQNSQ